MLSFNYSDTISQIFFNTINGYQTGYQAVKLRS